jgi:hypothetical protein
VAGLIIEIIDRSRSASITRRFDSFPVSIGRGYQNDLVVPDPFVSPEHLCITEDETGFIIEDLASENGVYVHGRRAGDKSVHIVSGDRITIGGTSLRLLAPSHPVPPALKLDYWSKPGERAFFRIMVWASLLPTFGVFILDEYFSTITKVRFLTLTGKVIPLMIVAFAWAGLWSLIGYSVKRQARFHAQLLVGNAFLVAVCLLAGIFNSMEFALNSSVIITINNYLVTGILLAALIFFSLGFATTMRKKRRITASCVVAVVVILVAVIKHFADKPEFEATPTLSMGLKPPYVKLARSVSIDEFLKDSAQVFAKSKKSHQ